MDDKEIDNYIALIYTSLHATKNDTLDQLRASFDRAREEQAVEKSNRLREKLSSGSFTL